MAKLINIGGTYPSNVIQKNGKDPNGLEIRPGGIYLNGGLVSYGGVPPVPADPTLLWALDLTDQDSTYACTSAARTCWGYSGDPAAGNPPRLITGIGAGVDTIVGGRWTGSAFVTTFVGGATMHPFTAVELVAGGTENVFTAFADRADSTGYLVGDQIALLSDNGNWLYATCSTAGTSAASQPSYDETDISGAAVTDGTAAFEVKGYATMHKGGYQVEPAATNVCTYSRSLDNVAWADSATATQNQIGIDAQANSATHIEDDAATLQGLFKGTTVDGNTSPMATTVFVKKDADSTIYGNFRQNCTGGTAKDRSFTFNTATGVAEMFNGLSGTVTTTDFGDFWRHDFTMDKTSNTMCYHLLSPAWGTISGGAVDATQQRANVMDSVDLRDNIDYVDSTIITEATAVTRNVSTLTDTTADKITATKLMLDIVVTPWGAGQTAYLFGTYVDANNYTAIITAATTITLRKRIAGANTDLVHTFTHTLAPFRVHAIADSTGMYLRAYDVGDAVPNWDTSADTAEIQVDTNFQLNADGNDANNFSGKILSAQIYDSAVAYPGNVLTLTDITDEFIPRTGATTDITVTGTYQTGAGSIQARVVLDGTSTEAVGWTTIDASPTGGTYSGTIATPDGGPYNVQVRGSSYPDETVGGSFAWLLGYVFGMTGQSNAYRMFTDGTGSPHAQTLMYKTGYVGHSEAAGWATMTGQGAISLANYLRSSLSAPVALIKGCFGSVSLLTLAAEYDYWLDLTADKIYDNYTDAITAIGGRLSGTIWTHGTSDVVNGETEADYETGLGTLFNTRLRADISDATHPVYHVGLGKGTDAGWDTDVWQGIRNAGFDFAAGDANTYVAATRIDIAMLDTAHHTPAGYAVLGQRIGQGILHAIDPVTYHWGRGPTITSFTVDSTTQVTVTIAHSGSGDDITPVNNITGFELFDDAASETITAAVKGSGTTIVLTTSGSLDGTITLRYLYGKNPTTTGCVKDNTTLALPLEDNRNITEV